MSSLREATPIILAPEERAELESLARSTKTEHRTRFKARIVLMAAGGAATRATGRTLECATGTASKWRVRYAKDRLAGFSETGNRRAEAKYGEEAGRRILAVLDTMPPAGYANWSGPLAPKAVRLSGSIWPRPTTPSCSRSTKSRPSGRLNARKATSSCPTGGRLTGQSHDYKRHGTTTLFAALNVASGKVIGRHYT